MVVRRLRGELIVLHDLQPGEPRHEQRQDHRDEQGERREWVAAGAIHCLYRTRATMREK